MLTESRSMQSTRKPRRRGWMKEEGLKTRTFEYVCLEQCGVEVQRAVAVLDDVLVEVELGVAERPVAARKIASQKR
jgi:hypothetical protein